MKAVWMDRKIRVPAAFSYNSVTIILAFVMMMMMMIIIIIILIIIIMASGQIILTKDCIAVLSPLSAANGLIWTLPHLINGSLGPHESAPKQHLDQFTGFFTAHPCAKIADLSPACHAVIEDLTRFVACLRNLDNAWIYSLKCKALDSPLIQALSLKIYEKSLNFQGCSPWNEHLLITVALCIVFVLGIGYVVQVLISFILCTIWYGR